MSNYFVESQAPHARSGTRSPWTRLPSAIRRQLLRIRHQRQIRRDVNRLLDMDDSMLKDIGLTRGDVVHAARYGRTPVRMNDRVCS